MSWGRRSLPSISPGHGQEGFASAYASGAVLTEYDPVDYHGMEVEGHYEQPPLLSEDTKQCPWLQYYYTDFKDLKEVSKEPNC